MKEAYLASEMSHNSNMMDSVKHYNRLDITQGLPKGYSRVRFHLPTEVDTEVILGDVPPCSPVETDFSENPVVATFTVKIYSDGHNHFRQALKFTHNSMVYRSVKCSLPCSGCLTSPRRVPTLRASTLQAPVRILATLPQPLLLVPVSGEIIAPGVELVTLRLSIVVARSNTPDHSLQPVSISSVCCVLNGCCLLTAPNRRTATQPLRLPRRRYELSGNAFLTTRTPFHSQLSQLVGRLHC
jgi:hypothetical protein